MAAERVLALQQIRKGFGGGEAPWVEVLHGIDLVVEKGEFVALTGPSGSGKSTLLAIMGLLDTPSSGQLCVAGQDTSGLGDAALTALRNQYLGFVFQFHHLLPAFSALENVLMPLYAGRGRLEPWMAERAKALLERVGLGAHVAKKPVQLSGGQQQRVALVRALASQPRLVLADEPTGNLDTQSADEVFELMRELNRAEGVSFLIVTHDRGFAARCDRQLHLVDGQLADAG